MKITEKPFWLGIIPIILAGFILRVHDLGLTLPYFISDGGLETQVSLRMLQHGDFNPHYFKCGGFPLYFLSGIYWIYLKAYYWLAAVPQPFPEFLAGFSIEDNGYALFYLGKCASLVLGLGIILLVFRCADIIFGRRTAWLAAFFAAVSPILIFNSMTVNMDAYSVFFLLFTLYFSLRIRQSGQFKYYLWAGVSAGLTVSSKYNILVAVILIGADYVRRRGQGQRLFSGTGKLWISLYTAAMIFFFTSPYTILDFHKFISFFGDFVSVQNATNQKFTAGLFRWIYTGLGGQLAIMLPLLAGPLYIAALLEVRNFFRDKEEFVLLGMFPLLYLLAAGFSIKMIHISYSLPVLPFLLLLGSGFIIRTWDDSRRLSRYFSGGLIAVALIFSLSDLFIPHYRYPFIVHRDFGKWVEKNIPPGQKILITWTIFPVSTRFWPERAQLIFSPGEVTEEKIRQDSSEYVEILKSRVAISEEAAWEDKHGLVFFDVDRYREITRRIEQDASEFRAAADFGIPRFWGRLLGLVYPWYGKEMEYVILRRVKDGK